MSATLTWRDERTTGDILARQLAMLALGCCPGTAPVDALVRHGCATLTGQVDSAAERLEAERVVRAVPGITAILNCIEVKGG